MHAARRSARLFVVAAVTVLCTGCLRLNVDVEVRGDGSGSATIIQAFDLDTLEGFAPPEELDQLTDPDALIPADLPEGIEAEVYDQDGYLGVRFSTTFDDPAQLEARLAGLSAAVDQSLETTGGGTGGAGGQLIVEETADGWRFEAPGVASGEASNTGEIPPFLLDGFDIRYTVALPGEAVDQNADEVDGSTFTWVLAIDDERTTLFAETEGSGAPGGGGGIGAVPFIVGGGVLALVLLAALGFALASRRKTPVAAAAPSGWPPGTVPPGPPGGAPWPPTSSPPGQPAAYPPGQPGGHAPAGYPPGPGPAPGAAPGGTPWTPGQPGPPIAGPPIAGPPIAGPPSPGPGPGPGAPSPSAQPAGWPPAPGAQRPGGSGWPSYPPVAPSTPPQPAAQPFPAPPSGQPPAAPPVAPPVQPPDHPEGSSGSTAPGWGT
jgi:hypothetical protein